MHLMCVSAFCQHLQFLSMNQLNKYPPLLFGSFHNPNVLFVGGNGLRYDAIYVVWPIK